MSVIQKFVAAGLALGLTASAAAAVTVGYTEGKRDQVQGTISLGGDEPGVPLGFDLDGGSQLGTGPGDVNQIDLHGRILTRSDTYNFTADSAFTVSLNFDGYTTDNGFVADSGFVSDSNFLGNVTVFQLSGEGAQQVVTDVTSGDPLLFSAGPGEYQFSVIGFGTPALYDIQIAAVPVPLAGLMLLSALGGLGMVSRRRK